MRKPTEYEIEQSIYLGGQISQIHQQFKEYAKSDPDIAFVVKILKDYQKLQEMKPKEAAINILTTMGELEFMRGTSELSKLSMILGDTRQHYGMRKIMQKLREKAKSEPDTT